MKNYNEILNENIEWAKETFKKVDDKMSRVTLRSRDKLADGVDKDGVHISRNPRNWTSGFWGGLNVLLYNYTKNEEYLKTAKRSEELMDEALMDFRGLYHDVGFMWHILSGALFRLTGDDKSKNRNLHMAANLFSRFVRYEDVPGGFIRAWNDSWQGLAVENFSIIDCLMNLPILYWASDLTGDDRFKRIAMDHADMALLDHLRADGSIVHIVDHDRDSGEVVRTYGGQGYCVGSSWSRGQAWGLYGFTLSYLHTKEERYLNAAKQVANYFIANCCDDWLPRVDFRAPSEPVMYDSTAGLCAACGMIELAKALPEHEGGMYMHAAVNILKAIEKNFADYNHDRDDLITHGTVLYPIKPGQESVVHISIIYADYFFTEALLKLLGDEFLPW